MFVFRFAFLFSTLCILFLYCFYIVLSHVSLFVLFLYYLCTRLLTAVTGQESNCSKLISSSSSSSVGATGPLTRPISYISYSRTNLEIETVRTKDLTAYNQTVVSILLIYLLFRSKCSLQHAVLGHPYNLFLNYCGKTIFKPPPPHTHTHKHKTQLLVLSCLVCNYCLLSCVYCCNCLVCIVVI